MSCIPYPVIVIDPGGVVDHAVRPVDDPSPAVGAVFVSVILYPVTPTASVAVIVDILKIRPKAGGFARKFVTTGAVVSGAAVVVVVGAAVVVVPPGVVVVVGAAVVVVPDGVVVVVGAAVVVVPFCVVVVVGAAVVVVVVVPGTYPGSRSRRINMEPTGRASSSAWLDIILIENVAAEMSSSTVRSAFIRVTSCNNCARAERGESYSESKFVVGIISAAIKSPVLALIVLFYSGPAVPQSPRLPQGTPGLRIVFRQIILRQCRGCAEGGRFQLHQIE